MPNDETRRIKAAELVSGYALSRLGGRYLIARGHATWRGAYAELVHAFGRTPGSWKRLRDEFDPFMPNDRRGFRGRPMRPDRAYVFAQLESVDDASLLELVDRFISGDSASTEEIVELIDAPRNRAANVAERLLTGRIAEEYFIQNASRIIDYQYLIDVRQNACGYDFDLGDGRLVEVKGIKGHRGGLLFTEREWAVAGDRRSLYLLVVVANLDSSPSAHVISDPSATLDAKRAFERRTVVSWKAMFDHERSASSPALID